MEFNKKLQELRKSSGLTQEELAEKLFVSRTAISKWESGRGYPGIDSLKAVSAFFGVTIDELLSGDEILTIAEESSKQKEKHFHDMIFGLLDCSSSLFFFLPFFGEQNENLVKEVSLLFLTETPIYLKASYFVTVIAIALFGILTLALQNCNSVSWLKIKRTFSFALTCFGVILFIISSQPYAAIFLFTFIIIKALMLIKKQ